jgi:hypothetical protein
MVTVGESVTAPAPAPEPCVKLSPHTAPRSDSLCHRYPSHDLRELHIFSGCFLVVVDFAATECPPAFLSLLFFCSRRKPEETRGDTKRIWAQAHETRLTTWVKSRWLAACSSPLLSIRRTTCLSASLIYARFISWQPSQSQKLLHAALSEDPRFANTLARGFVRFAEFLDACQVNIWVMEPAALHEQVREYVGDVFEIQRL